MRFLPQILCSFGVLAMVFACWGINTKGGRRAFDEMAGMIPVAVGVLGAGCVVAGAIWLIVRARSS